MLFWLFCRITSPFWYYITLFPILLHPFGIIFTLFPILLHPFGIIFTLLVILLHLFGVISTLLAVSLHCFIVDSSKPKIQNIVHLASNSEFNMKMNTVSKYFLVFEVLHTLMHRWIILRYQFFIFSLNISVYCVCFM